MAVLERRLSKPDSHFLRFAADERSQGGEDGILREVFRLLGPVSGPGPRQCVDVGAWDGEWLSNSYALLHGGLDKGEWRGLLIEANAQRLEQARRLYASNPRVICECSLVSFEGASSLVSILSRQEVESDFDFLSIDVDGADYHIWASLINSIYRPKVVCIEFNPSIPNDIVFIQGRSMHVHQGSSLLALIDLASSMRYSLIVTTTFNAIFIANEFMHLIPSFDNSIDKLHVPSMSTGMFQTYDGELKYVGCLKLLWHKVPINPDRLQVLKRKDRKYPFSPPSSLSLDSLHALCSSLRTIDFASDCLSFESTAKSALTELCIIRGTPHLHGHFIQSMHVVIDIIEEGLRNVESASQDIQLICVTIGQSLLSQAFHMVFDRAAALMDSDLHSSLELTECSLSIATSAIRIKSLGSCPTFHVFRLNCLKMQCLICRRQRNLFQAKYWLTVLQEILRFGFPFDVATVDEFENFIATEKVRISHLLTSNFKDPGRIESLSDPEGTINEGDRGWALQDPHVKDGNDRIRRVLVRRLESERDRAFDLLKVAGAVCLCSMAVSVSLVLRLRNSAK